MLQRNSIRLILFVAILSVLAFFAYRLSQDEKQEAVSICNKDETEIVKYFPVKDTGKVTKIIITDTFGKKVIIYRNGKQWQYKAAVFNESSNTWVDTEIYRARQDAVELLLKTFYRIELKSFTPETAKKNAIKHMSINHRQVDIFLNNKLEKTWFVGNSSKDQFGTYMMLELPDCGRSANPYIMKMAGFHGMLWPRFFTDDHDWRYTGLWEMNPLDLKEVEITPFEFPQLAFKIELEGKNTFKLYDYENKLYGSFDTVKARDIFVSFRKIHFESFAKISPEEQDSVRKQSPKFYKIKTVTKS